MILDYDKCLINERSSSQALAELRLQPGRYDPAVVEALEQTTRAEVEVRSTMLHIQVLKEGMIFAADVHTRVGLLVVCKGQEATPSVLRRLSTIYDNDALGDSPNVLVYETVKK